MMPGDIAVQCVNPECVEYQIPKYGPPAAVDVPTVCGQCWQPCEAVPEVPEVDPR